MPASRIAAALVPLIGLLPGCQRGAGISDVSERDRGGGSERRSVSVSQSGGAGTDVGGAESIRSRGARAFVVGMCSKCHGPDGTGGPRAPDLTDGEWLHCDGSVEGILEVLRTGVSRDRMVETSRPFAMNPVTNLVPEDEDLRALAAYVHSLGE